jgi:hypothetical protein
MWGRWGAGGGGEGRGLEGRWAQLEGCGHLEGEWGLPPLARVAFSSSALFH